MNNSLSMMGDQKANFDIFFSPPAFLHLGGIPEGVGTEKISHAEGFVGCMSNLKVPFSASLKILRMFILKLSSSNISKSKD